MPNDGTTTKIVVNVRVPKCRTQASAEIFDDEITGMVAEALSKESSLDVDDVHLLEWEDCKWAHEEFPFGFVVGEKYVELYSDGSWGAYLSSECHSSIDDSEGFNTSGVTGLASGSSFVELLKYLGTP